MHTGATKAHHLVSRHKKISAHSEAEQSNDFFSISYITCKCTCTMSSKKRPQYSKQNFWQI